MMSKLVVTILGLGYIPFMPGTFGSLAGLLIGIVLYFVCNFWIVLFFTITLFFAGWWFVELYLTSKTETHDPSEIIIDEVVGQLTAIIPLFYAASLSNEQILSNNFTGYLSAFILFRFFDILKPWPINLADQMTNSLGVMLDDVLAGIYTLLIISVINVVF